MAASSDKARRAEALAELVDQASRAVYSASYMAGLNPAQWNALRYLNSAQSSGRSIKAFSTYHRVTDSAASQTISALARKKLVVKHPDPDDGRAFRLELTPAGIALLEEDPLQHLTAAFATLSEAELRAAGQILTAVVRKITAAMSQAESGEAPP